MIVTHLKKADPVKLKNVIDSSQALIMATKHLNKPVVQLSGAGAPLSIFKIERAILLYTLAY